MPLRSVTIGGVVAVALLLSACSASPAPKAESPGVHKGGIATVALSDEPDSLDPTIANTFVARVVFTSFCEKLYDANDKLELVPQLAASLPVVSKDGLTVDIKLRKGVVFNDGTPFNAAAVKKTLDRNMTLDKSARKKELGAITSVTAVDDSSIRIALSRPYAPLGAQLADRAGAIMSPAALDKLGDNFGSAPVCVGPFSFKDRVPGSAIDLVKSTYYYDKKKVNLDGLTYKFITDPNIRLANLRSGDVNAAERLNASDAPGLKGDPTVTVHKVGTIAYESLAINLDPAKSKSPLATNPELRTAFELSLDRNAINQVGAAGQNVVDCLPLPEQSAFRPDDAKCSTFDPAAAKAILKKSGETLPVPVELMIPARPADQKNAELIQQMANKVGFKVTIKPVEFVSSLVAARAGDFQMFLIGWSGRIDPDGDLTDLVTTGGSNNYGHIKDAKLDSLISQAASVTGTAQRKALYGKALTQLDKIKSNIYLYHDSWFLGTSGITGVGYSTDAIPRFKTAHLTK
jgi:peptide/nickel transport system substrate-binding protein